MSPSEKTQHAIRRSTRLLLEVPVLLTSLDPGCPFSQQCNTTLVNAHGCGVVLSRAVAQGIEVRLEIVSAKRCINSRVVAVVSLGGDPETWLVGLEFAVPGNFWGIEYAPSDWKIEETPSPAAAEPPADQQSSATAKPAPSRRWRLSDISAGACYLETVAPFSVDTAVLVSIRASGGEWLLAGVVRVSHPKTGMGVEFTGKPPQHLRVQVEDLIGHLTRNREVPKIFVGREERDQPALKPAPEVAKDDESPDPLLELVRRGPSLAVEKFMSDLRAQRVAAAAT